MRNEQWLTFSVRMPATLRSQLERIAKAQERRPSQVVRRLIRLAWAEVETPESPEVVNLAPTRADCGWSERRGDRKPIDGHD